MNMTIDPGEVDYNNLNSEGHFWEEPDFHHQPKKKLNFLKESISQMSSNLMEERMFIKKMINNSSKKYQYQSMSKSPYARSIDGFSNNDDKTLPNITNNRNAPIKSPVMESIRMSRQNKSKQFMSLQKYRNGDSPSRQNSSWSDSSNISKNTNIRKSYILKRNNPKNVSMNRGTFFVHKREKTANPVQKNENIVRASTILNASMMFGKKRGSKAIKNKGQIMVDADADLSATKNEYLKSKRKSKTFIEKEMFKNKLATANNAKREKILNPWVESKESPDFSEMEEIHRNMLLSHKSIKLSPRKFHELLISIN
jgi:hypothetical protein